MPIDGASNELSSVADKHTDRMAYVAVLVGVGTVASLAMSVSPLIVDGLVTSDGLSLSQAGYITSVETAGVCLGTVVSLLLASRQSPRILIGAGLLLMIAGNFLSAKAVGFWGFASVRAATGFGCGLTMVFTGLLAQTVRPQRNYAIYMGANVITVALIGAAVPALLAWQGVAAVYSAIAITGMLCLASLGILPSRPAAKVASNEQQLKSQTRNFWLQRWVIAAGSMEFLFAFSLATIWTYMVVFGVRSGVSETETSFAVSLSWLGLGTAGSIAAGILDGRVASRTLIWVLSVAFIGNVALLWYGAQPALFYLSVGMFIFVWSFIIPPILNILAELDSSGQLATSGMLVQTAGFSVGPAVGAAILQHHSLGMVAATTALGFAGLILALRLVNHLGHPLQTAHYLLEPANIIAE